MLLYPVTALNFILVNSIKYVGRFTLRYLRNMITFTAVLY